MARDWSRNGLLTYIAGTLFIVITKGLIGKYVWVIDRFTKGLLNYTLEATKLCVSERTGWLCMPVSGGPESVRINRSIDL